MSSVLGVFFYRQKTEKLVSLSEWWLSFSYKHDSMEVGSAKSVAGVLNSTTRPRSITVTLPKSQMNFSLCATYTIVQPWNSVRSSERIRDSVLWPTLNFIRRKGRGYVIVYWGAKLKKAKPVRLFVAWIIRPSHALTKNSRSSTSWHPLLHHLGTRMIQEQML